MLSGSQLTSNDSALAPLPQPYDVRPITIVSNRPVVVTPQLSVLVMVGEATLTRISHQVATRMVKNNLFLSIYPNFPNVSPGQTALGARPLVRNAGQLVQIEFPLGNLANAGYGGCSALWFESVPVPNSVRTVGSGTITKNPSASNSVSVQCSIQRDLLLVDGGELVVIGKHSLYGSWSSVEPAAAPAPISHREM